MSVREQHDQRPRRVSRFSKTNRVFLCGSILTLCFLVIQNPNWRLLRTIEDRPNDPPQLEGKPDGIIRPVDQRDVRPKPPDQHDALANYKFQPRLLKEGLIYISFGSKAGKYNKNSATSFRSCLKYQPDLRAVLFTTDVTALSEEDASLFLQIVKITDLTSNTSNGWINMVEYQRWSPFTVTLKIDSDLLCCSSLAPLLKLGHNVSIFAALNSRPCFWRPKGGLILSRWSPTTAYFYEHWVSQWKHKKNMPDDQQAAVDAGYSAIHFTQIGSSLGVLNSRFLAIPFPCDNFNDYGRYVCGLTFLLPRRPVVLTAMGPSSCELFNERPDQPRLLVYRNKTQTVAYNKSTCGQPCELTKSMADPWQGAMFDRDLLTLDEFIRWFEGRCGIG
eukprot:gb/GEZN01006931.1/.p1 GENE.gb/GEZN01006931.1/~~gb/GEZN01006931.1/.p1  ORF type:complete len:389 (-),score=4.19 gb/GEZN01006931.1/:400-1566(-)